MTDGKWCPLCNNDKKCDRECAFYYENELGFGCYFVAFFEKYLKVGVERKEWER